MWPWVTKKLLKCEKVKKKNILFTFNTDFVHFFCEKVTFLTAPAQSCQFYIGVTTCVWWLETPLRPTSGHLQ